MEWFNTNVASRDAALEQRPEVLKAVGVNLPINIFLGMVNNLMGILGSQSFIGEKEVAIEGRTSLYVLLNFGLQNTLLAAGNYGCANISPALKDTHNGGLVASTSTSDAALLNIQVHVASLPADEGFIYFDFAAQLTAEGFILQGETNSMQHEPCSLLGDVQVAGEFATADSVLAIGEQPQSGKPLIQTDGGILTNASDLDRELALGVMFVASPSAALLAELCLVRPAGRADDASRPATDGQVVDAIIRIREVNDCFLKALWFAHGLALHKQNYRLKPWSSQVNNHPNFRCEQKFVYLTAQRAVEAALKEACKAVCPRCAEGIPYGTENGKICHQGPTRLARKCQAEPIHKLNLDVLQLAKYENRFVTRLSSQSETPAKVEP